MGSLNKATILGRLGKDPELRTTGGGTEVANFSVATSETFTDKNNEKKETTEWHSVVVWGKLAGIAKKYLAKGREVLIEGKLQTRSWDDKDGTKKYKTEIVASNIVLIGGGGQRDAGSSAAPSEVPMPDSVGDNDDLPF